MNLGVILYYSIVDYNSNFIVFDYLLHFYDFILFYLCKYVRNLLKF